MNFSEFAEKLNHLTVEVPTSHSLEQFLRAMWRVTLKNKAQPPTWALFHQIISEAWTGEPMPFDDTWREIKESADSIELRTESTLDDFEYYRGTILFQIVDLRLMDEADYWKRDPWSMVDGVKSPLGEYWYNLSPEIFCQCAIGGMTDHAKNEHSKVDVPDEAASWRNLAEFLYLGQLYE